MNRRARIVATGLVITGVVLGPGDVAAGQPAIRIEALLSHSGAMWPEGLATGKLRFPTPPWSQR